MGANPHANGGLLLRDLRTPDFREYAVDVPRPGAVEAEDMPRAGQVCAGPAAPQPGGPEFPGVRPRRDASNGLSAAFQATGRRWRPRLDPAPTRTSPPTGG